MLLDLLLIRLYQVWIQDVLEEADRNAMSSSAAACRKSRGVVQCELEHLFDASVAHRVLPAMEFEVILQVLFAADAALEHYRIRWGGGGDRRRIWVGGVGHDCFPK